jgi:branched-subunit amino acid aminotransferase/4-amino-4-deoxychorismate lyase
VREAVLREPDLLGADEAFITSTTREVVPVVLVDHARIGGPPGEITRAMLDAFRDRVGGRRGLRRSAFST